ncbi:hypothetical protein BO78DRAFT_440375 [Aspergillus sclerotiicarbonarius CBS 121057]|uniref:D-isomer specific 2-hydroxyacid dehydrogenase n=1 Tax=Aspergillus sclerotiicarbonarius (strain CBS 121057 / IBT 28362) TaxID=1448318 RepID=A0A319EEW7_ASPSB|nr:hypothetical protein BO78DRAFT_440375 [Aspergillus sclerotiicarbonarius CBS 121057]
MDSLPKILVIGDPKGLVPEATWADFSSKYEVHLYDFATLDDFHQSMSGEGSCHNIIAIVRLGLNIPPGIEKVGQGWTKRGLPYFPPSLRLVVNFGHGYDEEDVPALEARGITFANTTGGTESTATLGTFLIISSLRNLSRYERMVRAGQFLPALRDSAKNAVDPFSKKLGIFGMGAIGQAVARQTAALGMEIHCLDRKSLKEKNIGNSLPPLVLHPSLGDMVANVDCVILTCSYTPETHHVFSHDVFSKMRPGTRVVNIARGKCIDDDALCDAIEKGNVGGVGLDVHDNEPYVNPRLLNYDCVTLLPHVGGLTHDSMSNHAVMALQAAQNYFSKLV